MPATITHAYFAKDVFDILPKNINNKINIDRIKMFGQSMDSLMFYNLFSPKSGKKIRDFGHYFHSNKSQDYFICLIHFIKENKLYDDIDVCSYLCGLICHYVLDSTIHPFVFYKTGKFEKGKPSTYKYNNVHSFMELFIDNDMVRRREKMNPYRFAISNFCFDMKPFSKNLNLVIDYSFKKTFSLQHMSYIYYKSLKQMNLALRIFRKDTYGIKKFIYKMVDTITPRSMFRFEAISYHYPLKDVHNFLNSDHKVWRNPTTYNMTSTESFIDLYLKSIKLAKSIIISTFFYFDGESVALEKIFINKSYLTGLDCNLNRPMKYFEF